MDLIATTRERARTAMRIGSVDPTVLGISKAAGCHTWECRAQRGTSRPWHPQVAGNVRDCLENALRHWPRWPRDRQGERWPHTHRIAAMPRIRAKASTLARATKAL